MACAAAIAFPPWGWDPKPFLTFAFIFSEHVLHPEYPIMELEIAWRYLVSEIVLIILVGAAVFVVAPQGHK
jgi:hypothetical protein